MYSMTWLCITDPALRYRQECSIVQGKSIFYDFVSYSSIQFKVFQVLNVTVTAYFMEQPGIQDFLLHYIINKKNHENI